jgi:hypothetical protein
VNQDVPNQAMQQTAATMLVPSRSLSHSAAAAAELGRARSPEKRPKEKGDRRINWVMRVNMHPTCLSMLPIICAYPPLRLSLYAFMGEYHSQQPR